MGLFRKKKKDERVDKITAWANAYRQEQEEAVPSARSAPPLEEEERRTLEAGDTEGRDVSVQVISEPTESEEDVFPHVLEEVAEPAAEEQEAVLEEELLEEPPELSEAIAEVEAVEEEPSVEITEEEPPKAPSLFQKLRSGLSRTRDGLVGRIDRLLSAGKKIDANLLEELEEILIESDIGVEQSLSLIGKIQEGVKRKDLNDAEKIKGLIRQQIEGILHSNGLALNRPEKKPCVIMVVGVNGVGKTTTIAKLAWRFIQEGESVLLAAGDTFRAAAIEQLEIWGQRVGADVVKHKDGADPSAVIFDALKAAEARGTDVVIADTAGRLHTKVNLMEELKKMKRVMDKVIPGAPHEVLLVLDATTGQNALSQAKIFHEATGLTGIALTKLDGTAKGGIVTAIVGELGIPVKLIGIGEGMEDLRDFHPEEFVSALFDE
jgi:fused signal recognition particle receptor